MSLVTLSLIAFVLSGCQTAPLPAASSNTGAMMYLSQFGWLDPRVRKPGAAALVDIRSAIKDFQSFAGLNQTGDLDEETVVLMGMPRCGVRDKIGPEAKRKKRYALQGSRWKVRELTYRVTKFPSGLRQFEVNQDVDKAFKVWEEVTNLTFTRLDQGKVHIDIRFEKKEHGDGDPFDGEGGTLAHAYFPVYGGDAHFDDEENWTVKSSRGTNLFQVAAHEFGHSLGLTHSDVRTALMAPFYRGYQENFKLDHDDILGIQHLYGKKEKTSGKSTPKPRPPVPGGPVTPQRPIDPKESKLCKDPKVDAITVMSDGFTYAFKGSEFYRLNDDGIAPGYPRKISSEFGSLPSNINAAFTWTNDKTYFFKGSQYWRFTDNSMDSNYPKEINDGFEGIPSEIDAAFVWPGNGKIYFFKNDQYWRFDPARRPPVSAGYPKPLANWKGVPSKLDAVLRYTNGYTYFFKANKYWRFNDRTFEVDNSSPPFPRSVENWWFGCGKSSLDSMKNNAHNNNKDLNPSGGGDEDSGSPNLTTSPSITFLGLSLLLLCKTIFNITPRDL